MKTASSQKIDLDGKTWLSYSISVWDDIRKSADEIKIKHPAMFPLMLCERLIRIFSKEGDLILDPFAGSGSTIIAASKLDRKGIGIELSPQYISIFKSRLKQLSLFDGIDSSQIQMKKGDTRNMGKYISQDTVSLTITSPPYWDILNQRRTADGKSITNYGNSQSDLGNIESYQKFLLELKTVYTQIYKATKPKGYCCIIVMDLRKGNKFYPFHIDNIEIMRDIGFELDDIIVWDRKQEYNNLRPLGYPTVFRINKVHEFILIFQKNKVE